LARNDSISYPFSISEMSYKLLSLIKYKKYVGFYLKLLFSPLEEHSAYLQSQNISCKSSLLTAGS
jgi:hypothetical protein